MRTYFTKLLLGFKDEDIIIKNFIEKNDVIEIDLMLKTNIQECPACSHKTRYVHDYRKRSFKHGKTNGYFLTINYFRRRYVCKECSKRFPEKNTFVDRYAKISNQLNNLLIKQLKDKATFKQIAKDNNVSSSTVIRRFDKHFDIDKLILPNVISIDEFKKSNSNSKMGKYALAIADPINKKIFDIIPNRRKNEFNDYLEKIPVNIKNNVNTVIIDMWEPYRDLTYKHFPNANLVIDRFHFIRNVIWWFNDIRIKAMNSYNTNQKGYRILKKYNKLLIKNPNSISSTYSHSNYWKKLMSQKSIIDECLNLDQDLNYAYKLYEYFQKNTGKPFKSYDEAVKFIDEYVQLLFDSKLHNSQELASMFINWKKEIANSLSRTLVINNVEKRYTNGFIEGVNNYIKTFRRMCFNIRNFDRFKTRIITTFNKQFLIKA